MATDPKRAFPGQILLATDLSARCDRALDRACALAAGWGARLTVVHALEPRLDLHDGGYVPSWRRDPDRRYAVARRRIQEDMLGHDVPFDLVLEEGDAADTVQRIAETRGNDFIVTGIARGETLGRLILGGTVERLVRDAVMPVLVVKARARRAYEDVIVAVDFSKASRLALARALHLLPEARITLLHCYEAPASGFVDPGTADRAARTAAEDACAAFLKDSGLPPDRLARLPVLLERGSLDGVVQAYAMDKPLDLLVIGSQGRNAVARFILGSTAELLLSAAPCDVLVVNGAQRN